MSKFNKDEYYNIAEGLFHCRLGGAENRGSDGEETCIVPLKYGRLVVPIPPVLSNINNDTHFRRMLEFVASEGGTSNSVRIRGYKHGKGI